MAIVNPSIDSWWLDAGRGHRKDQAMTRRSKFKTAARKRMAVTSETYTAAKAKVVEAIRKGFEDKVPANSAAVPYPGISAAMVASVGAAVRVPVEVLAVESAAGLTREHDRMVASMSAAQKQHDRMVTGESAVALTRQRAVWLPSGSR